LGGGGGKVVVWGGGCGAELTCGTGKKKALSITQERERRGRELKRGKGPSPGISSGTPRKLRIEQEKNDKVLMK